uniref:hypothetical protein n=1 Tax=Eubacterium cellulosolvens TaxID=29322 RepID=UPI000486D93C|nr:hypothetical protein [[Eubacterium] cellulosolvens]
MERILDKISEYTVINNIFPGAIFVYMVDMLCKIKVQSDSILIMVFVYYFLGVVLSRIGSIVVEPILKKCKILKHAKYEDFVVAEKKDDKIQTLLGVGNMYRTLIATVVMLLLTKGAIEIAKISSSIKFLIIVVSIICLMLLLILAYVKQTNYIRKRVECLNEEG